jgi:hypothetical protein
VGLYEKAPYRGARRVKKICRWHIFSQSGKQAVLANPSLRTTEKAFPGVAFFVGRKTEGIFEGQQGTIIPKKRVSLFSCVTYTKWIFCISEKRKQMRFCIPKDFERFTVYTQYISL